jgi:hypothetical protein
MPVIANQERASQMIVVKNNEKGI